MSITHFFFAVLKASLHKKVYHYLTNLRFLFTKHFYHKHSLITCSFLNHIPNTWKLTRGMKRFLDHNPQKNPIFFINKKRKFTLHK